MSKSYIILAIILALNPILTARTRTQVVINGQVIVCSVCGKPACFISVVGNQVKALCFKCVRKK